MCIIILNLNKHHPKLVPHPPLNNAVPVGFHSFLTRLDFTNMIIATKNIFKKNALYLSVNVFSTEVLIGDTILTSPTGEETAILLGHLNHAKI